MTEGTVKTLPQQGTPWSEWMKVYSADGESHPTEIDSVSIPVGYFKANQYFNL